MVLVGKSEGKRLLGKSKCRWQDDIQMDLGWEGMVWIDLVLDRGRWWAVVNAVINLLVP